MSISDEEYARRVTRYEVAKRAMILFISIVVTVSLMVLMSLAIQSRQRGKESQELLRTIQSCTQPSGECYQRGRRSTAQAVSNINRVVILAAACASGLPSGLSVDVRQTRIQSCVISRLAAHAR